MKQNTRKEIIKNESAVSAVIAVTLMVAVTIAMAAVGYAYLTGMIGGTQEVAPIIEFTEDEEDNRLTVTYMDQDSNWEYLRITATNTTDTVTIQNETIGLSGPITVGEQIDLDNRGLTGTFLVTIVHLPSDTQVGDYTLEEVEP